MSNSTFLCLRNEQMMSYFLSFDRFVYEFNRVKSSSESCDSGTSGSATQAQLKKTD